jgi:hypothetical protein
VCPPLCCNYKGADPHDKDFGKSPTTLNSLQVKKEAEIKLLEEVKKHEKKII